MLKLKKIAVTGGLGCGKSTVCDILKKLGCYVVNTDDLAHELLQHNEECIQKVVRLLGQDIKVDDHIDRKKVAELVFSNKEKLFSLEKILHPLVFKKMDLLYKEACNDNKYKFFVAEVPLLYESGWEFFFDLVILVSCSEPLAIERAQSKGISRLEYHERMHRLLSIEEKKSRADFIIINDQTTKNLEQQVNELITTNPSLKQS